MASRTLEKDGVLWYDKQYLIEQIENAYRAAKFNSVQIQLCVAVEGDNTATDVLEKIREIAHNEFQKDFIAGHVWREGNKPSYLKENITLLRSWNS